MSIFPNKLALFTTALSLHTVLSLIFSQPVKASTLIDVSEIDNYTQIYQLDIVDSNFSSATPAYNTDNSATVFSEGIDRIGYYLELESETNRQWVWASMDAFTQDLNLIGVPTFSSEAFWQQNIDNMNVESNVAGIVTGMEIGTGNIEFWSNNYTKTNATDVPGASDDLYDFGDEIRTTNPGYGSMQIHNYGASQILLAYNGWGNSGADELGIGNNSGTHPDWTFQNNLDDYTVRNLEVWVEPSNSTAVVNEFSTTIGLLSLGGIFTFSRIKKNLAAKKRH